MPGFNLFRPGIIFFKGLLQIMDIIIIMEVKIDEIVIGEAVIHPTDSKIIIGNHCEEESAPEKVWETSEIVISWTMPLPPRPFMPPHPYNMVLFYWYLIRNGVLILDSSGECWELYYEQ